MAIEARTNSLALENQLKVHIRDFSRAYQHSM